LALAATAPHDLAVLGELYPFVPRRLAVPGGALSYLDEGQGPPVLLLHGNPTWSLYYRRLVLALRATHRVIVPDHLGCGLSDKPLDYPYRLANHIENVGHLLRHLGISEADLVVHDWGGAIGMGAATLGHLRARRIVVLNTAAFLSPRIPLRIALCKLPLLGALAVRGLNGFAGAATFMATERPLTPELRRAYLLPYHDYASRIAVHRFVQDIPLSPAHPTWALIDGIDRELATLRDRPMLILWGGKDWCFSDYFLAGWLQRFPAAQAMRFDDAGHYVLEDAHAEIVPRIVRFLV
jgi:cis-3-alkyl-4-acyloxetan-2-one decarboxylase